MEIQEFFFWVASIVLILLGLFIVGLFALLFYIKKLADNTSRQISTKVADISDQFISASRIFRNLTLTRFVIKILRYIF